MSTSGTGVNTERHVPEMPAIGLTDYTRWRLKDDDSRHTWHYLADEKEARDRPQTYAEKYFLNLPLVCTRS